MANSFNTSSLPAYVEQKKGDIIRESVLGAKTARRFTRQGGVKGSQAINLLSTDVTFGSSPCAWNENAVANLTQRVIATGVITVDMAYCYATLLGKWAEFKANVTADQSDEFAFETEVIASLIENINLNLDKAIWQGDKSSSDDNLNKFDGMLKILGAESTVVKKTIPTTATYYSAVKEMVLAMPTETLEGGVIYAGYDFVRGYEMDLLEKNLYHYDSSKDVDEILIPASSVKLVAVAGLNGTKKLVAGQDKNFFYGYDKEGAENNEIAWYSKDNKENRVSIAFNAGVQVAFPDQVVLGTYTTINNL